MLNYSGKQQSGFTLLELLVVMVIMGIMLGAISFTVGQSTHQQLRSEAERIALLLDLVREEAIVRNRPTMFEADEQSYQFKVRNEMKWELINDVDTLRKRDFVMAPVKLELIPNDHFQQKTTIVFGKEPVHRPFELILRIADDQVRIRADGVGHFEVSE
jgi:general secretion pathway protein H